MDARDIIALLWSVFLLHVQEYGRTALAWAARNGHEPVVDALLKAGADPDIQDKVYNS